MPELKKESLVYYSGVSYWLAPETVHSNTDLKIWYSLRVMEESRGGSGDEISVRVNLENGTSELRAPYAGPFAGEVVLVIPHVREEDVLVAGKALYDLVGELQDL